MTRSIFQIVVERVIRCVVVFGGGFLFFFFCLTLTTPIEANGRCQPRLSAALWEASRVRACAWVLGQRDPFPRKPLHFYSWVLC